MSTGGEAVIEGIEPPWTWHHAANYSAAVRVGGLVHVSGQVGLDRDGMMVDADFLPQARQAFANLADVLRAAGSDLSRVVKVSWFLTDRADFRHVPALRAEFFAEPYPADTTVIVAGLAREGLVVEIEALAVIDPLGPAGPSHPPHRKAHE